ncbi:MAG: TrkA C-terminal domain-containing protein [bacterium]
MAKRKNLKEILILLRNFSQLMVQLGYAAIMEDSIELAKEALRVKSYIRDLDYELRKEALMVARLSKYSKGDIPQIANLLQIGVAIKEMSDGVDDLIDIAIRDVGVHPIIQMAFTRKEMRTMRYEVEPGSKLDGKKLEELDIDPKSECRTIAVRRKSEWFLDPRPGMKINDGDVLIVEGRNESINKVRDCVKAKKKETKK